jgi:hypothetical protein
LWHTTSHALVHELGRGLGGEDQANAHKADESHGLDRLTRKLGRTLDHDRGHERQRQPFPEHLHDTSLSDQLEIGEALLRVAHLQPLRRADTLVAEALAPPAPPGHEPETPPLGPRSASQTLQRLERMQKIVHLLGRHESPNIDSLDHTPSFHYYRLAGFERPFTRSPTVWTVAITIAVGPKTEKIQIPPTKHRTFSTSLDIARPLSPELSNRALYVLVDIQPTHTGLSPPKSLHNKQIIKNNICQ